MWLLTQQCTSDDMNWTRLSSNDLLHSIGYYSKYLGTAEINKNVTRIITSRDGKKCMKGGKQQTLAFVIFVFCIFVLHCWGMNSGPDTVINVISIYSLYTVMNFLKTFSFVYIMCFDHIVAPFPFFSPSLLFSWVPSFFQIVFLLLSYQIWFYMWLYFIDI